MTSAVIPSQVQSTTSRTNPSANTDFLSDSHFLSMDRDERRRILRNAWLARIEPEGTARPTKVQTYVDRIRHSVVFDQRLTVFQIEAQIAEGTTNSVLLSGEALQDSFPDGVADTLKSLGFTIARNGVRLLPAANLERDGAFAVATSTHGATMRRSPRIRAEQVHEIPTGAPIRLLREASPADLPAVPNPESSATEFRRYPSISVGQTNERPHDWFYAQSMEGYIGFVRGNDIVRTNRYQLPDGVLLAPIQVPNRERPVQLAAATYVYRSEGGNGWVTRTPPTSLPSNAKVRTLHHPLTTEAELRSILEPFVGQPYEWGGTTSEGIDCSGLTQFVYRSLGIHIPRDAEEQAILGKIVAWGNDAVSRARAGDLLFFTNARGRVSHVAVSLGNGLIAHAHERSVKIEPVSAVSNQSRESLVERILFARRVAAR